MVDHLLVKIGHTQRGRTMFTVTCALLVAMENALCPEKDNGLVGFC